MQRDKLAKEVATDSEDFLERNPKITEALRLFSMSYDLYWKAIENSRFYNSISTSPLKIHNSYEQNKAKK